MNAQSVFLALPHNGYLIPEAIYGLGDPVRRGSILIGVRKESLLARCFNGLWADAYNLRAERKLTHFAMHHSDVATDPGWCDTLIDELERTGADVMSAVVPIKDGRGLTSTGWAGPTGTVKRLTLAEVRKLPRTFDVADVRPGDPAAALMVNTGLWVCRFADEWVREVCFTVRDGMELTPDGRMVPRTMSEDWGFSAWAHRRGLRVFATTAVRAVHFGVAPFASDGPPGCWETDRGD